MNYDLGLLRDMRCQTQSPFGLRRGSAAALLLRLRVRIPPVYGCLLSLLSVVCCRVGVLFRGILLGSPGIVVMGSRLKLPGESNFDYH